MAPSYTARLGLKKPAGIDNYNIADNNGNADILDAFLPLTICTSVTRPASPFNGQGILETDTGRIWFYITALAAWVPNLLGGRPNYLPTAPGTAAAFLRGELVNSATLAGNRFIDARLAGAANPGYAMDFDGKNWWGPGGGTALDTNLYRDSAHVLATDDMLLSKHSAMQAQQVYDSVNRTTTSTTLTDTLSTGAALAITTVVPPSGKLLIGIANRMFPSTPPAVAQTTARISGTNTQTPDYSKTLSVSDATTDRRGLSWVATGLTAGGTVTVTMQHSVGSGTGNFDWRALSVVPLLA
jgi:hypothetical protein